MQKMKGVIRMLNSYTPEQFYEQLTKQPIIQSAKDVIQSFRNFGLTNSAVNALLYYMLFMDQQSPWDKLSRIAQFFAEHDVHTAEEAIDTLKKLQQYESQLDDR